MAIDLLFHNGGTGAVMLAICQSQYGLGHPADSKLVLDVC
jgi:hypothetical protein